MPTPKFALLPLGLLLFLVSPAQAQGVAPQPAALEEIQSEVRVIQRLWAEGKIEEAYRILAARQRTPGFASLQPNIRAGIRYNLACAASRLGRKAEAMTFLREAVAEGFSDWTTLKGDADLDPIRTEAGFADLSERVRSRGDFQWLLQRYPSYEQIQPSVRLGFTYQPATHPDLVNLRREWNLDAVAGSGDAFSRMVRLMRWVHAQVRHDGESLNPKPRDAKGLLEVCRREGRGINCRMMAIILHEAYLAMGFKSRHLTCLPMNEQDPDCHVITCVWSEAHQKWLYMDPTFEAYFMDEKGVPLSVPEVRERLVTSQPLALSPGANWNGKPKDPQEYKSYMAKNLFRIQCPVEAAPGYESRPGDPVYVALDPLNVPNPPMPRKGTTIIHNQAAFWERP